jgi:two-component system CheB/CheR fusion protein
MLPHVFEAFAQADASIDRSKGGLGLGLAVVESLVCMHGGSVRADSGGQGTGATFTVTLPLDSRPPLSNAEPPIALEQVGRRVLIIEDNGIVAMSFSDVLALDGHTVEVAYDGREGLEKARSMVPDVVFCDIGLPVMDGYAVARALRADPALSSMLLVALTGYARPEDVAKTRAAGFDAHLTKPASPEAVARLLARFPARPPERAALPELAQQPSRSGLRR